MKNEVNSKRNPRTEHVTYLGRQVKSGDELLKMLKIKREKIIDNIDGIKTPIRGTHAIDDAHIAEVQGPKRNQNMPSRNVGGTKASKSQLVGVQG
ncbi:hypothetical protein TSUD_425580, partial [Trifolium subterraneum]